MRKQICAIQEAKTPLVPKNDSGKKPTGKLKGDTIKMTDTFNEDLRKGTVWRLYGVYGEPSGHQDNIWHHYYFIKVLPNGTTSKSLMQGSTFVRPEHIDRVLDKAIVLEPNKPYTQGEVTLEELKQAIKDSGVDKLLGLNAHKLISKSRNTFDILLKNYRIEVSDPIKARAFKIIVKVLDSLGVKYYYYTLLGGKGAIDKEKGYPDNIVIDKRR
jgi:hypothetical protein